jgi:tetratricopeptide (TPR) repeat protein
MGRMTTLELPAHPVPDRGEDSDGARGGGAIVSLGSWMAILGSIRLVLAVAEYATAYREALGSGPTGAWRLAEFLRENPPVFALIGAWPLALGLMLMRTRWPELVKAGALTFLILSIGGALTATSDWSQSPNRWLAIGSFRVSRVALLRLAPAAVAPALAGAFQLLLELATALRAVVLAFRGKDGTGPALEREGAVRRSRLGRLAVCVSIVFLALTIRVPAGSAFLEIINQSRWIRDFILRDDMARIRSTPTPRTPESQWIQDGQVLYNEAYEAWGEGRYGKARDAYLRLASVLETIPTTTMSSSERQFAAQALNNTAWLLATCPDLELRDHADAVKHARRSIELEPNTGNTWNTLGVAYFRMGDWEEARNALYRSMELRNEGDSFDWFFLAMIHAHLGRKERAREWYDKASQATQPDRSDYPELYRFQAEAAAALGLPKPDRPEPRPLPTGRPPVNLRSLRPRGHFTPADPGATRR